MQRNRTEKSPKKGKILKICFCLGSETLHSEPLPKALQELSSPLLESFAGISEETDGGSKEENRIY